MAGSCWSNDQLDSGLARAVVGGGLGAKVKMGAEEDIWFPSMIAMCKMSES